MNPVILYVDRRSRNNLYCHCVAFEQIRKRSLTETVFRSASGHRPYRLPAKSTGIMPHVRYSTVTMHVTLETKERRNPTIRNLKTFQGNPYV
jgi:hypothetical protein